MVAIFKAPCDEQVIAHKEPTRPVPCPKDVGRAVLIATILASSMVFIDSSAVNVALPTIQRELGATAAQAQWVVESYALFLAALLLVGGVLGDRYGRKRIFLLGTVLFAATSVWCGLSPDYRDADRGAGGAGRRRGAAHARQPGHHQRGLQRRDGAWPGHRHLVRIHGHHRRIRSGARRVAGRECLLALGVLHQPATGGRRGRRRPAGRPREPRRGSGAARRHWRRAGDDRSRRARLRADRGAGARLGQSARARQPGHRRRRARRVHRRRDAGAVADDAAGAVSLADLQRGQSADPPPLWRVWRRALLAALQPHPGPGVHRDRGRRRAAAGNPDHLRPLAADGRAHRPLWRATAADHRAQHRGASRSFSSPCPVPREATGRPSFRRQSCSASAWRSPCHP